jgi:RNA polymerase sigma factor (sigma-70 family)
VPIAPFSGVYEALAVYDLPPLVAGFILDPLDLTAHDGWRLIWEWERRLWATGDVRGVRLLVWWHRHRFAALFAYPDLAPQGILWLALCWLRHVEAVAAAVDRYLRGRAWPAASEPNTTLRERRGDLPEDLGQHVLLHFERSVFREDRWPENVAAYLATVARNVIWDRLRKATRAGRPALIMGVEADEAFADEADIAASMDFQPEIAFEIHDAMFAEAQFLATLSRRQRTVLTLRLDGMTSAAIARRCRVSRQAISKTLAAIGHAYLRFTAFQR